jgi:hypothetical protein
MRAAEFSRRDVTSDVGKAIVRVGASRNGNGKLARAILARWRWHDTAIAHSRNRFHIFAFVPPCFCPSMEPMFHVAVLLRLGE